MSMCLCVCACVGEGGIRDQRMSGVCVCVGEEVLGIKG